MHLLNRIPLEIFRQHPKWLIGHGDITMLLYVVATTGTLCVHGPMGFQLPEDQDLILFIEEVEESLHTIDRLFYMLRLQNSFERIKGIIFGAFNHIRYDLQFGSVEQMLIAHLHDIEIPVCCGFPVGSNSCIPLIEGAPCSLTVTSENSVLTFNIEGNQQACHIEKTKTTLLK